MRIYALGNADLVLGFELVGVEGYATNDPAEAAARFDALVRGGDVGLILVSDDLAGELGARIDQLRLQSEAPLVLEVPTPGAPAARESLAEALRRAIGIPV